MTYGDTEDTHAECRERIAELQGALDAQDRRELLAGEKCGIPWEDHGCDWPAAVAERVVHLRAEVARLTSALNDALRNYDNTVRELKAAKAAGGKE